MTGVAEYAGRGNRWHVATESDNQGDESLTGKANRPHHPVGHDGRSGHVARVLENCETEEHQRHQRGKGQDHTDALNQSVDQQPRDNRMIEPRGF